MKSKLQPFKKFLLLAILITSIFSCNKKEKIQEFNYDSSKNEISFKYMDKNVRELKIETYFEGTLISKDTLISEEMIYTAKLFLREYFEMINKICYEWTKNDLCKFEYKIFNPNGKRGEEILLDTSLLVKPYQYREMKLKEYSSLTVNTIKMLKNVDFGDYTPFDNIFYRLGILRVEDFLFDNSLTLENKEIIRMALLESYYFSNGKIRYMSNSYQPQPSKKQLSPQKIKLKPFDDGEFYYVISISLPTVSDNFSLNINDEIKSFIKTEFRNKYANAVKKDKDGYVSLQVIKPQSFHKYNLIQCLLLLSVNSDNSYNSIPLADVCIDDIAPETSYLEYSKYKIPALKSESTISEKYRIDYITIENKYELSFGDTEDFFNKFLRCYAELSTGNFSGYGNSYNVPFILTWVGDLKEVQIFGEAYDNFYYKIPVNKTINVTNLSSPYHFNLVLSLGLGDNFIPVKFIDQRGNITDYNLNIELETIKN